MNSWHAQQLKFAFGIGGFMSFYGIVSLVVWLLGDKMGFPVSQRIVVIALILLTLPLALIVGYAVTRRSKKKKEAKENAANGDQAVEKTPADKKAPKIAKLPDSNDLSKGAEEVIQFLKSSNLGENGKDAVYSLPWYIVAGAPKSGKSSLVMGSSLNFQNLPSQRESEQKFVRPGRGPPPPAGPGAGPRFRSSGTGR